MLISMGLPARSPHHPLCPLLGHWVSPQPICLPSPLSCPGAPSTPSEPCSLSHLSSLARLFPLVTWLRPLHPSHCLPTFLSSRSLGCVLARRASLFLESCPADVSSTTPDTCLLVSLGGLHPYSGNCSLLSVSPGQIVSTPGRGSWYMSWSSPYFTVALSTT